MTLPSLDLEGRRALVTGGSAGGGLAIAAGIAAAGADVVICGRHVEPLELAAQELSASGATVMAVPADVTIEEDVARLHREAGQVDILVNNAGMGVDHPWTQGLSEWRRVFALNLDAPFRLCQQFAPAMIAKHWGRIINVASVYGEIAGDPRMYPPGWDQASYFASKAGLLGLTRYLAVRLARDGVTVNALSPGSVLTDDQRGELSDEIVVRKHAFAERMVPIGRPAAGPDLQAAAVFLASPGAAYVTGQNLIVDGGWSVW